MTAILEQAQSKTQPTRGGEPSLLAQLGPG